MRPSGAAQHALRASRVDHHGTPSAGATGLEPATSGVTGRRSNQLSYAPGGGVKYDKPLSCSSGGEADRGAWADS